VLQSDGDPENFPPPPKIAKYKNLAPQPSPQYSVENGMVRVAEKEAQDLQQDPSNILKILQSLSGAPLRSTSPNAKSANGFSVQQEGASVIDTNKGRVSLSYHDWGIVKDCLTVVHYMNDFSPLDKTMFAEARVAWIRQFGWAPSLEAMYDAKIRAQSYRQEFGKHCHVLMTSHWVLARKTAYDCHGEGTAWKETVTQRTEMPEIAELSEIVPVRATQHSQTVEADDQSKNGDDSKTINRDNVANDIIHFTLDPRHKHSTTAAKNDSQMSHVGQQKSNSAPPTLLTAVGLGDPLKILSPSLKEGQNVYLLSLDRETDEVDIFRDGFAPVASFANQARDSVIPPNRSIGRNPFKSAGFEPGTLVEKLEQSGVGRKGQLNGKRPASPAQIHEQRKKR
jgi:hypothetical protein